MRLKLILRLPKWAGSTSMYHPPRKTIRLANYDYTRGATYFVTVCVHASLRRKDVFGSIVGEAIVLNRFGRVVEQCWAEVPEHRPYVILDSAVVMPNHAHFVFHLEKPENDFPVKRAFGAQPPGSLGLVVGAFKSEVKRRIGSLRGESTAVWKPRFYDRIIRNEAELVTVRRYLENNPAHWINDRCHPEHREFDRAWMGKSPDDEIWAVGDGPNAADLG